MTAQSIDTAARPLTHDTAYAAIAHAALRPTSAGTHRVGLELELHLVDLACPDRRPSWPEVQRLIAALPPMPSGSSVTLEPGGQIELSTPPRDDVASAVAALAADREALRSAMRQQGYAGAPLGADLARPVRRVNPGPRYAAMEQHFDALGCAGAGRAMMSSTAALQVNLDAGPESGWTERLALVRSLVPVLVALSSTSPLLGGRRSGWHSMRQETWHGIDHGRSEPMADGEPTAAWAAYALDAAVMLVRDDERVTPVTTPIRFRDWIADPSVLGRAPTAEDLAYHLTTLFPPVRPRGYVEIRCLDALPDRWWPALAALATTLVDDPVAADGAAALCEPVARAWEAASRHGVDDPVLAGAALGCVGLALTHGPEPLRPDLERLAELVASGRTPADEVRARAEQIGPLGVLEEEARV